MDFDAIVLGDYCLDLIFTGLDSMPIKGAEIESKALAMEPGGACNTSLALHRLGVKTAWAVEFGTDDFSKFILQRLRAENFPEDLFVFHDKWMRKITVSLSYADDRAFIAYYDQGDMVKTAIQGMTKAQAKLVIVPSFIYGAALTAGSLLAKSKKMQLFMDGNCSADISLSTPHVKSALRAVRFFAPNRREATTLTRNEDIEKTVMQLGEYCQTVIVKDGGNGAWCCDEGRFYHDSAYPVTVVDTTGAGDCFNAGFLKAWFSGKSIEECLMWGNVAGALSTQLAGANAYRLTSEEISTIVEKRKR
jgi:sugar/nucleoside kinase (ribokinase family)